MARVVTKKCPNCSGPLPATGAAEVVCEYCGARVQIEQPRPPRQAQPPRPGAPQVARPSGARFALIAIFVVAMLGVGVTVLMVSNKTIKTATRHDPRGGHSPKGESVRWDNRAMVAAARINDDAVDDIVGRYMLLEDSKSDVYVGAFDGATFERLWKAGPFGDISGNHAHMHTHFAVTPSKVAVSDYASMVHILDRATGAEQRSLRLSDRVTHMCVAPGDRDAVWLAVADENDVELDLRTGETTEMSIPDWCPGEISLSGDSAGCWRSEFLRRRLGRAECVNPGELAEAQGFAPEYGLRNGDQLVAVGNKDPGSRLPMAAGYDGKTVRWVRQLSGDPQATVGEGAPEVADLGFGHLVVQYQVDKKWRLISLDPATGDTQWEVQIPNTDWADDSDLFLLTEKRLYLPNQSYLHVFDTATGRLLGTIGRSY